MLTSKKSLSEQVVVITGASIGIGLTTARIAAERGATVVLVARNAEVLAREAGNIESNGGRAIHVAADVGSKEELQVVPEKPVLATLKKILARLSACMWEHRHRAVG